MFRASHPFLIVVTLAFGLACSPAPDDNASLSGGSGAATGSGAAPGSGGSGPGSGGSGATGSGGTINLGGMAGGMTVDACALLGLPPDCETKPQPGCGDGMINQGSEECDDGNSLPGDCCSGACTVEPYCDCTDNVCRSTIICGDGVRGPGEACDDGDAEGGDGCSEDCHVVEIGYRCMVPGEACVRFYVCGDGIPDPNEGCDDGGATPGDGCSERCRIELGFKCEGAPSVCSATTCGDSMQEGAESCDDGNTLAFDGCSPDCRAEPVCETGEACTSSCGDGIVFGGEQCDDGNLRPGDGCSDTCMQEEGYVCNNDAPCERRMGVDPATRAMGDICTLTVPAVFRDFNAKDAPMSPHPDFFPGFNSDGATQGLVKPLLDGEGKPELVATNLDAFLHGAMQFRQWYRNDPPASRPIPSTIVLWDKAGIAGDGTAGYVNRWGALGERWTAPATYANVVYGGPAGGGCEACTVSPTGMCFDPCIPWAANSPDACCGELNSTGFDGNPLFFPIDTAPGILNEPRLEAKVPEQYGWVGWPWEDEVAAEMGVGMPVQTATAPFPSATHNFHFTTEVKYWFRYDETTQAQLDFTGDDDVWVFLNGHLAIDLGSWHVPLDGVLAIDGAAGTVRASSTVAVPPNVMTPMIVNRNGTARDFGLENGNVYQIAVFHAERQKEGSSFKLTLSGFNATPSDCRTNCGDMMVGPGEECDDGTNRGGYNECAPGCVLGPRCGDGVAQTEYEACDDGMNLGTYGGCGADCQPGPRCGDAFVTTDINPATGQPYEQCDDGMNLGTYGGCAPGCIIGPHCGDGSIAVGMDPTTNEPYEQCDDGNTTSNDGCSNCKIDIPDDPD